MPSHPDRVRRHYEERLFWSKYHSARVVGLYIGDDQIYVSLWAWALIYRRRS